MLFVFCTVATSKAADNKGTTCKIQFSLHGWSAFSETASGTGPVSCDNGQTRRVKIEVRGGGLTAGKSSLKGVNLGIAFGKFRIETAGK